MILTFVGMTLYGFSQQKEVKADCKPTTCSKDTKKSCGPADTKTGEAQALTLLRAEIQSWKSKNGLQGVIPPGAADDSSLEILVEEMKAIAASRNVSFPEMPESAARQVATLRKLLNEL